MHVRTYEDLRAYYGPTSRNARTTQTLRRSREPVLFLRQVLLSGPITALAAVPPRRKNTILGGARKALAVDARRDHNQPLRAVCEDICGVW